MDQNFTFQRTDYGGNRMSNRSKKEVRLHFNTALYLMESLKESMTQDPEVYQSVVGYTHHYYNPEHSDESIIRRCIQIRQELLQVIKKLR